MGAASVKIAPVELFPEAEASYGAVFFLKWLYWRVIS